MNNYIKIIELLNLQRDLFQKIEIITNQLISEPIEELTSLIEERGNLLEEAITAEKELRAAASNDPKLKSILNCNCDMSDLSSDFKEIYETLIRVKSIINRINQMETEVFDRIEREKSSILNSLESLNNSGKTVADNYRRAVQTGYTKNIVDEENRKI